MLLIECPFCGPRAEIEFSYGGPAASRRPDHPEQMPDAAWVDWLTVPENRIGPVPERWCHSKGCGAWLTVLRDTRTHDILEVRHGA